MRDKVYSTPQSHIVDFAFSAEVAAVFPDMIRRSVPGYDTVIPMTGLLTARHLEPDGVAYDLGCSLGATTQAILSQNHNPTIRVFGVDNSEPMIAGANEVNADPRAKFYLADILGGLDPLTLPPPDVIILNFVLQFCEREQRQAIVDDLFSRLRQGGMLLLSEKVTHPDSETQSLYDETHLGWKRANGYSELEVAQKRSALENVMRVDTEEDHCTRLKAAGFPHVEQWYRCLNWASFIAVKTEST